MNPRQIPVLKLLFPIDKRGKVEVEVEVGMPFHVIQGLIKHAGYSLNGIYMDRAHSTGNTARALLGFVIILQAQGGPQNPTPKLNLKGILYFSSF
jgi:hypothetical protein